MLTTIEEIYRARLKLLIKQHGKQADLAKAIGKSPSQVSQWVNASPDSKTGKPRCMERQTAREIERTLKLPDGWMDQPVQHEQGSTDLVASEPSAAYLRPDSGASAAAGLGVLAKFISRLSPLDRNLAVTALRYLLEAPTDTTRLNEVQQQLERLHAVEGSGAPSTAKAKSG